jgi:hypothetical protein
MLTCERPILFVEASDMKLIPLTQGQTAIVDDEDYEELVRHKWQAALRPHGRTYVAVRMERLGVNRRHTVYMHRVIMGALPGQLVDHRFHDTLDNRRSELRICTNAENMRNQKPQVGRVSAYKGLSWRADLRRWQVKIGFNGCDRHLGYFADEIAAARAYDTAARKLFGEFAYPNFPLQTEGA